MIDKETEDKFWSYVEKTPGGCWDWGGSTLRGYGKLYANGQMHIAHRLSWMLENGEIEPGMEIHHKCGNRGCVNPDHLEMTTHGENMEEAASRGAWSGSRNGRAKRTESEIKIIRCLKAVGMSVKDIAASMSIPLRSVYYALKGWKHVEF